MHTRTIRHRWSFTVLLAATLALPGVALADRHGGEGGHGHRWQGHPGNDWSGGSRGRPGGGYEEGHWGGPPPRHHAHRHWTPGGPGVYVVERPIYQPVYPQAPAIRYPRNGISVQLNSGW